jgi:hypothetical protein
MWLIVISGGSFCPRDGRQVSLPEGIPPQAGHPGESFRAGRSTAPGLV